MGKNGFFNYTSNMRISETKRNKYNKLIDNKKYKTFIGDKNIKEWELNLSEFSKKTTNLETFNKYEKFVR